MRSHAPFEPIVAKFCMWGRWSMPSFMDIG